MKRVLVCFGAIIAFLAGLGIWWRRVAQRRPMPFPARLSWMLTLPRVEFGAGSTRILDRLDLAPGLRVLDAGSGPGRVSIPAARRVGVGGTVVALDMQPAMLRKLERRARVHGVNNIETIEAGISAGKLEPQAFDRALLVAVLGEIPDRRAALRELYRALKPGGILSITEGLPDPHYQRRATVIQLAEAAGFRRNREYGGGLAYTINFVKPV